MDNSAISKLLPKNRYVRAGIAGTALGWLGLAVIGRLSGILPLIFSWPELASLPESTKGLVSQAYYLYTCQLFMQYGFWFTAIPVTLLCLIEFLSARRGRSRTHYFMATTANSLLYCAIILFAFGFSCASFFSWDQWLNDPWVAFCSDSLMGIFVALWAGMTFAPLSLIVAALGFGLELAINPQNRLNSARTSPREQMDESTVKPSAD